MGEETKETKTFAEWWDDLERNGRKLEAAPFLKSLRRSKKHLTFEEFADP